MEKLKEWAVHHKALAIGGGLAALVLLYLWLRSGSTTQAAGPDTSGLQAYYAAQASAAGDAASSQQSTNALAAQTAQTNAEEAVALAETQAQQVPYQDQLQATTLAANLTAYQDFLAEQNASGPATTSASNPTNIPANFLTGTQTIPPGGDVWGETTSAAGTPVLFQGVMGDSGSLIEADPASGALSYDNESQAAFYVSNGIPAQLVTWQPGSAPQPWVAPTKSTTTPLTFQQFLGTGGAVTPSGTSPAGTGVPIASTPIN